MVSLLDLFMYHFCSTIIILLYLCCSCAASIEAGNSQFQRFERVFCVTEKNSNNEACQDYDSAEYKSLSYYMRKHDDTGMYFMSNQIFVFDQGRHTPLDNFTLKVSDVTNLSLIGSRRVETSAEAVIDCKRRFTKFLFQHFSNITIANLTFSACQISKFAKHPPIPSATLVFVWGFYLHISSVKILMSVDEGFFIKNIYRELVLSNVEVSHANTAGKHIPKAGNAITYQHCDGNQISSIFITDSVFTSNSNFVNDGHHVQEYAAGLSVNLECPNIRVTIDRVTVSKNTGGTGGNIAIYFFTTKSYFNVSVVISNSKFEHGYAAQGAGMFCEFVKGLFSKDPCEVNSQNHTILQIFNTTFSNNIAQYAGGGIYMKQKQSLSSCNRENIVLGNVTFNNNFLVKAMFGGIAFHIINFMVTDYLHHEKPQYYLTLMDCTINNNSVIHHDLDGSGTGTIFTKSNYYFKLDNTAIFNNRATGLLGMSSNIILSRNVTIVNNTGSSGGGVLLYQNAVLYVEAFTNVTIARNHAYNTGGGICVETDYLESKPICFFQVGRDPLINPKLTKTVNITLHDNQADFAGDNIFGGSIDHCYMIDSPTHKANRSSEMFHALFTVPRNDKYRLSSVSSPPRHVCPCKNGIPWCNSHLLHSSPLLLFPGEIFYIQVALVGQRNGTVPGAVKATLKHNESRFEGGKTVVVRNIRSKQCQTLKYTINTSRSHEALNLEVQLSGDISGFAQSHRYNHYYINITIKKCPIGFAPTFGTGSYCDCNSLLKQLNDHISCNIKTQTIRRVPSVWIGTVESNGLLTVAYHQHCPFDYCTDAVVNLHVLNESLSQDDQCAFNRTGIMCGSCPEGLSVILGSSECHYCSNYWLLLHIPMALLGIIIIFLLTILNITIAEGTLSGLIFYCNIVWNNISLFFPGENITFVSALIKMFLSLINLDVKITLCLFNGMDAYSKTWLHFGFPLYLWLITGILVYFGGRCSWIIRRNMVKVLATLILLSYARLLTSVTEALQASTIYLQDGTHQQRWLMDGNIQYFKGRHIPLVIFATLFSLLLFLFALCLFLIQCLHKVSHLKIFCWVNYFKPILDAYTGPFTSGGRFWTGLLLLLRIVLTIVSAVNTSGSPRIILSVIVITVISLLCITGILSAGLYRRLNMLECTFLLNLGVLSALLFVYTEERLQSMVIANVFVSTSLLMSIGIIIYHILCLKPLKKCIPLLCCRIKCCNKSSKKVEMDSTTRFPGHNTISTATFPPFQPFNEDREPLLVSED